MKQINRERVRESEKERGGRKREGERIRRRVRGREGERGGREAAFIIRSGTNPLKRSDKYKIKSIEYTSKNISILKKQYLKTI